MSIYLICDDIKRHLTKFLGMIFFHLSIKTKKFLNLSLSHIDFTSYQSIHQWRWTTTPFGPRFSSQTTLMLPLMIQSSNLTIDWTPTTCSTAPTSLLLMDFPSIIKSLSFWCLGENARLRIRWGDSSFHRWIM